MRACEVCGKSTQRRGVRCKECAQNGTPIELICYGCEVIFLDQPRTRYCSICKYDRECSIDGCTKSVVTRPDGTCAGQYCSAHSSRFTRKSNLTTPVKIIASKGSGTLNSDGYRLVQHNGRQRGEHRVVMEQLLNRSLEKGENVHHINGVRTDNRPENLELWVVSQPKGQRVEDVVAWAKEILNRYAPNYELEEAW